jgi:hypothetical protein
MLDLRITGDGSRSDVLGETASPQRTVADTLPPDRKLKVAQSLEPGAPANEVSPIDEEDKVTDV